MRAGSKLVVSAPAVPVAPERSVVVVAGPVLELGLGLGSVFVASCGPGTLVLVADLAGSVQADFAAEPVVALAADLAVEPAVGLVDLAADLVVGSAGIQDVAAACGEIMDTKHFSLDY